MTNIMLEVKNLKKIYDELGPSPKIALDDLSFEIKNNEFVCIMGPSGSGKTTLVNILSTIDKATSGIVNISGASIVGMSGAAKAKFRKKKLGFIFQNYNLLYSLTIRENILFPLIINSIGEKEWQENLEQVTQILGIKDILDKHVYECSGGQQQRAAIARALISKPEIIIADEPTGNLDSVNSHELLMTLKSLNEQDGVTIIMVSHDPMIASYSSRFVYIKDGHIAETLQRQELSQDEYFQKIVDINSLESRKLFEKHHD